MSVRRKFKDLCYGGGENHISAMGRHLFSSIPLREIIFSDLISLVCFEFVLTTDKVGDDM